MARYKSSIWKDFIAPILAILPHAASDPDRASASDLNTQDQRDYRQNRQSTFGKNDELAGPEIRESLDNLHL